MLMKDFRFLANKEKSSFLLGVSKHQEAEKIFRFVNACITQSRLNTHDLGCISCSTSMELILADVLFFCMKTEKKACFASSKASSSGYFKMSSNGV